MRERGAVHPREVDDHFSHGTVTNYWGGSSSATTHLLDAMHYRGFCAWCGARAAIRIYAAARARRARSPAADAGAAAWPSAATRIDALVDVVVRIYAPLPGASLSPLVRRLRYAVPQWRGELEGALKRARHRLAHARVDGIDWYWPAERAGAR